MEIQTSGARQFNLSDLLRLLQNIGIFFIPMAITLLTAVQAGQNITRGFVEGLVISTLIKIFQYYEQDNNMPKLG